jgi:CDP-diacylglycerol--glycerol-3-phosphate 3-phosphatidyltransferase/cardiolipin synthase
VLSISRLPLALLFILVPGPTARVVVLGVAALTDLLDGWIARRLGPSRVGTFIDPVADRLFMACAFGVVAASGLLRWYEIVGVLARDLIASAAFFIMASLGKPAAIPARVSGKVVTVAQVLTLLAFLLAPAWLRPLAWVTTAAGVYAILDYYRSRDERRAL